MGLLHLTEQDRSTLLGWTRRGTAEARLARRAKIVLAFAEGAGVIGVARKLGIGREQAALWRDRFLAGGTKATGGRDDGVPPRWGGNGWSGRWWSSSLGCHWKGRCLCGRIPCGLNGRVSPSHTPLT